MMPQPVPTSSPYTVCLTLTMIAICLTYLEYKLRASNNFVNVHSFFNYLLNQFIPMSDMAPHDSVQCTKPSKVIPPLHPLSTSSPTHSHLHFLLPHGTIIVQSAAIAALTPIPYCLYPLHQSHCQSFEITGPVLPGCLWWCFKLKIYWSESIVPLFHWSLFPLKLDHLHLWCLIVSAEYDTQGLHQFIPLFPSHNTYLCLSTTYHSQSLHLQTFLLSILALHQTHSISLLWCSDHPSPFSLWLHKHPHCYFPLAPGCSSTTCNIAFFFFPLCFRITRLRLLGSHVNWFPGRNTISTVNMNTTLSSAAKVLQQRPMKTQVTHHLELAILLVLYQCHIQTLGISESLWYIYHLSAFTEYSSHYVLVAWYWLMP